MEQEVLETARQQHSVQLADSWHPLIANSYFRGNEPLYSDDSGPFIGPPLTKLRNMMRAADRPHAAEVSIQRAARRLAEKGFLERSHLMVECWEVGGGSRYRSVVCVRLPATAAQENKALALRRHAGNIKVNMAVSKDFSKHAHLDRLWLERFEKF